MADIREKLRNQLQNQEIRERERPSKNKYLPCLILVVVIVGFCGLLFVIPMMSFQLEIAANQRQWQESGIDDYTLSIASIGYAVWELPMQSNLQLVIHDGQVVNVTSGVCENEQCNPDDYRRFTVEWLFDAAYQCRYFCGVDFDPTYGYPVRISKGFIEGGWLEISLQPK
jgi:hypothetical protein